jgi:hypothetical protein
VILAAPGVFALVETEDDSGRGVLRTAVAA